MPYCAFTNGASSDMIRLDTVARSRTPCSMREKRARLVLSQSCSAFFKVKSLKLRIISLMLSFSAAISPEAATAIEQEKTPKDTTDTTTTNEHTRLVRV